MIPTNAGEFNARLIDFIDASPSPWHAVVSLRERLEAAGFVSVTGLRRPGPGYFASAREVWWRPLRHWIPSQAGGLLVHTQTVLTCV